LISLKNQQQILMHQNQDLHNRDSQGRPQVDKLRAEQVAVASYKVKD
jgi:hypothetical protein